MKKRSIFGYIIGAIVMVLTVGIVAALFTHELPQGNREVALVILGTVIGWASTSSGTSSAHRSAARTRPPCSPSPRRWTLAARR